MWNRWMPNQDVLSLELFQSKMERLIEIAMDDPIRYFKNFLKENEKNNPNQVPIWDGFIYCCVWAFIFTSPNGGNLHADYYSLYNEQIDDELETLKNDSNIEAKRSLEKYPMIRSLLYHDEECILKKQCHTISDYLDYIQKYGDACRELTLYAKYRISTIDETELFKFDELIEVINTFPYSDLFDIDKLKSRCVSINGLMVCYTNNISPVMREMITHIIENSKQTYVDDERFVYYVGKPLTKREIIVLQGYDCQALKDIISDFDEPVLLRLSEVTALMNLLKIKTGLDWVIPDKHILREHIQSNSINNIWYKGKPTSLNIEEYYSLLPTLKSKNNG